MQRNSGLHPSVFRNKCKLSSGGRCAAVMIRYLGTSQAILTRETTVTRSTLLTRSGGRWLQDKGNFNQGKTPYRIVVINYNYSNSTSSLILSTDWGFMSKTFIKTLTLEMKPLIFKNDVTVRMVRSSWTKKTPNELCPNSYKICCLLNVKFKVDLNCIDGICVILPIKYADLTDL